jgi:hypothetical protein
MTSAKARRIAKRIGTGAFPIKRVTKQVKGVGSKPRPRGNAKVRKP